MAGTVDYLVTDGGDYLIDSLGNKLQAYSSDLELEQIRLIPDGPRGAFNVEAINTNFETLYNRTASLLTDGTGSIFMGSVSATSIAITGLTASKPIFTDASKNLSSSGTVPLNQGGTEKTTIAADKLWYSSALDTLSETSLTAFSRTLLDDSTALAWSQTLSLEVGVDVQAYDADLTEIAALLDGDGTFIVGDGGEWTAESADVARTSLGVGTGDSPTFTGLTLSGLTDTFIPYSASGVLTATGLVWTGSSLLINGPTAIVNSLLTRFGALTYTGSAAAGHGLALQGDTETDTTTGSGMTATVAYSSTFGAPTLAASNANVTTTDAATVYISGAPVAGTNMTLTNPYALIVDAGDVRIDDNLIVGGTVDGRDIAADGTAQDSHIASTSNPHSVTSAQVGFGTGDSPTLTGLTLTGISDDHIVHSVSGVMTGSVKLKWDGSTMDVDGAVTATGVVTGSSFTGSAVATSSFSGDIRAKVDLAIGGDFDPLKPLHIRRTDGTTPTLDSDVVILMEASASAGDGSKIQFVSGATGISGIHWGHTTTHDRAFFNYDHSSDSFTWGAGGSPLLALGSTGLSVGHAGVATDTLDVNGTANISGVVAFGSTLELGHATDSTISRVSAGQLAVEGVNIAMAGGAFHDGFSDFVSDEHVAHGGVTLTAGTGLDGGGTIAASRTFNLDSASIASLVLADSATQPADLSIYSLVDGTRAFTGSVTIDSPGILTVSGTGTSKFYGHVEIETASNTTFTLDETATGVAGSRRTIALSYVNGRSTTGVERTFSLIQTDSTDATNTSEDSELLFKVMSTGTLATEASIIGGSGLTLTNELTVSGTGTSSFAGKVDVSGPTWNDLFEVGLTGTAEVFRIWNGGSYFSFAGGSGGTTEMVRVQHDVSDFQILSDKLTVTGTGTSSIAGLLIASNHVRMENTSTDYMTYDHEGFYRYSSTWTETTHWQFRNTWTAATGDMVYISNAGNQTAASDASMILSDNTGLTFGKGHADGNQLTTQVFSVAHSGNIVTSGTLTVSGTGISTIEGDLDIEAGALNVGNPSTKYTGSQGIRIKATGASEWFTMETGTSTWNLKDWSGTTLLAANGTTNAVNVPADFSVGGNVTVSGSGNHDFSGTLRTELIRDLSGDIMVYHDSNNLRLGGGNVLFTMGLWSGGAENITLDTSGNVAIPNGTLTVSGTGDSSFAGKILIKETSTNFQEDYVAGAHNPTLQVNDSGNGGMSFTQWHTTQTHGAYLWLAKSNNTSIGSHTVVNFNETLGAIHFAGSDGTTFNVAAMIQCQADLACGANDMPGRLIFSTTANAANTPTEAMRIDSSQNTTLAGTLTVSGSGDSSFVGSVGIGTTSIDELLHIEKDQATGTKIRIENESSANLAVAGIDFKSDGSNDFLYSYGSGYTANLFGSSRASTFTLASQSTNELNIGTIGSAILRFGTNNAERMQITSGGNVLIGTTTDAGQKFQVDAGVVTLNKEGARIEADITTNASAYTNTLQLSDGDSGTASIAFGEWNFASIRGEWEGSGAAGRLTFYNRTGSGAPTEKMRLTSTGDLLIGTTTAATNSLLTVNAGITVNTEGIEILEDTPTLNTNRLSQESGSLRWEGTVISLSTHVHSASDITSGILGLTRGGTGQNAADDAFDALSPSSARGDIAVMGVSKNTALNLGTAGLALVSDGTDLVYGTPNSRLPVNGTTYAVSGAGPTAIDPAAGGGIIKLTHSGSGQTVVKIEDTYATDGDMIVCVLTAETGSGGVRLTETGGASRLDGGGTCDLDNGVGEDTCTLMYIGNVWSELSRSDPF